MTQELRVLKHLQEYGSVVVFGKYILEEQKWI